jgi:hypothetical protein
VSGAGAFEPDVSLWDAWHPAEAARRLAGVQAPWYVAAGWSIDLFLGGQHRQHEDLEIAVPQERFDEVARALPEFEFFVVGSGYAWPLAQAGALLDEHHQTWARELATGRWRLDIFREPADGDTWICRRDTRIRLPYRDLIQHTPDGIPYARPDVALLFKAKHARPKDEDDLAAVLPRLAPDRRAWLAQSLALLHPDHPWLAKLG